MADKPNETCGCCQGMDDTKNNQGIPVLDSRYCLYPALKQKHDEAVRKIQIAIGHHFDDSFTKGEQDAYDEGLRFCLELLK